MNPEIIIHRVNTSEELEKIPKDYGVEIDIRAHDGSLILNHEPFGSGESLQEFLSSYEHGTLVANIKEAGIEEEVLRMLSVRKVENFFLLDVEMPYLFKHRNKSLKSVAIRFSEYEHVETAKYFMGLFDWLWIDTPTVLPIKPEHKEIISNYKTCIVCPERWGQAEKIQVYKKLLAQLQIQPDCVMTSMKYADLWLD